MIGVIKNESIVAIEEEVTEGTAVDPSGASSYIQVLSDGIDTQLERESIERDILSGTVENEASRIGIKTATATIPVEARANSTEGDAPEADLLFKNALGGKRQITADQTSGTTHTSTVINYADTSAFSVGDIVLVKEAGAYEVRPISAISTNTSITFPFALENGAPSDAVVLAQNTTYYHDAANATSMTLTNYVGNTIKEQMTGMYVASMELASWEVGQVPNFSFSLQGLNMTQADGAAPHTPSYDTALPPVILEACAWINGTKVDYTTLGLTLENTVTPLNSACQEDGKISHRITNQMITGTINPYMDDTTVTYFDNYNDNDDISIFAFAKIDTGTAGEFGNVVAIWIPQAKISSFTKEDLDGVYATSLEFKAHRAGSGQNSLFMSFI